MTLRLLTTLVLSLAGVTLAVAGARADDRPVLLGTNEYAHLDRALAHLNMSRKDLEYTKEAAKKPRFVLNRVQAILAEPLKLPTVAEEILAADTTNMLPLLRLAANLQEIEPARAPISPPPATPVISEPNALASLDPRLRQALEQCLQPLAAARAGVDHAFQALNPDERQYLAASMLADTFNAEDREPVRRDLLRMGIGASVLDQLRREGQAIDPEPAAQHYLDLIERIDMRSLAGAAERLQTAVQDLERKLGGDLQWPSAPVRIQTSIGDIVIGTPKDDTYVDPCLLLIEPGGNDVYRGRAASADGLHGCPIALTLDLDGDDQYVGDGVIGPGAALFGVCLTIDARGNDVYRAPYAGQAAGLFGVALLEDRAGDDLYQAQAMAQAAAYAGQALLLDREGNDIYDAGFNAQGFAGVRGVALLIDRKGNDRYLAGGRLTDFERHDDRSVSTAQGFAIGMRPFAGGGVAALVDWEGNDVYRADVYGQGSSYWYSLGLLLDREGNDSYEVYHYGQGSGIHLSLGLLYDGSGDDRYTGYILSQGNAHDYGVGMLLDRMGDDTYTADHYSQGCGVYNALGILIDSAGDDAYFVRQPDRSQGRGHDGAQREYGSLGLLLDLGGKDRYSCGAQDGSHLERPDYGIVYDDPPPVNRQ